MADACYRVFQRITQLLIDRAFLGQQVAILYCKKEPMSHYQKLKLLFIRQRLLADEASIQKRTGLCV